MYMYNARNTKHYKIPRIPYPEPDESSPLPPVYSVRHILVFVSYVCLGHPSDLRTKILCALSFSPVHAACPAYINRDLIILTISG